MAAPAKRSTAPAPAGFMFGDLNAYSSGGMIPEGDYWLKDLTIQMFQATKQTGQNVGPARLGVMITYGDMGGGEDRTQFYSLGSKAHESWAPNTENGGKTLVPIPGGPGTPPNASTNWAVWVKSMFDSGLPQGILADDLSVLEGSHVHVANVPEPEERKGFVSKTGEAAVEERQRTIAVVTEIKDDGKPWEGTGGEPQPKDKPNGKAGRPTVAAHPAPRAATPSSPAAQPATASATDDDVNTNAVNAISAVLEKNPNGLKKLQLRTGTFKELNGTVGQGMANKVLNEYFGSDKALNGVLNELGYTVKGIDIVPMG
jgi:hypothetical protein